MAAWYEDLSDFATEKWNEYTGENVSRETKNAKNTMLSTIAPGWAGVGKKGQEGAANITTGALGMLTPADNAATDFKNYISGDGALDTAMNLLTPKMLAPTESDGAQAFADYNLKDSSMIQRYSGDVTGMVNNANNTQGAMDLYNGQIENPTATDGSISTILANNVGPSNTTKAYGESVPYLTTEGRRETQADPTIDYVFDNSQNSQSVLAGLMGGGGQTASEAAQQNARDYERLTFEAQNRIKDESRNADGSLAVNDAAIRDTALAGTQGDRYYDATSGQLVGPGVYERRVDQAMGEVDPLFERQRAQGIAKMEQAAAARGKYGSGGALAGLAEYNAAADAQRYAQLNELARTGQEAQINRLTAGQQQAGSAQAGTLARSGQLESISKTQRDAELAERDIDAKMRAGMAANATQLAGQAGTERDSRIGHTVDAAKNADGSAIDAGSLVNTINTSADEGALSRIDTRIKGASAGDSADNENDATTLAATNQKDQIDAARMRDFLSASNQTDEMQTRKAEIIADVYKQMDDTQLARVLGLSTVSSNTDQANLLARGQYLDASGKVQKMNDDQMANFLDYVSELAGKKADIYLEGQLKGLDYLLEGEGESLNTQESALSLGIKGAEIDSAGTRGVVNDGVRIGTAIATGGGSEVVRKKDEK